MSVWGSESTGVVRGHGQTNDYEVTQSSGWHRPGIILNTVTPGRKMASVVDAPLNPNKQTNTETPPQEPTI